MAEFATVLGEEGQSFGGRSTGRVVKKPGRPDNGEISSVKAL